MPSDSSRIRLTDATRKLFQQYGKQVAYNDLWRHVAQGSVPAERIRGRWHVREADLPRIAEALGLLGPEHSSSHAV
jgi:hypothetical protein